MVSLIDTPFVSVPSSETGSNRFGSLARNSVDDAINGRFGETALAPEVDASYEFRWNNYASKSVA